MTQRRLVAAAELKQIGCGALRRYPLALLYLILSPESLHHYLRALLSAVRDR